MERLCDGEILHRVGYGFVLARQLFPYWCRRRCSDVAVRNDTVHVLWRGEKRNVIRISR